MTVYKYKYLIIETLFYSVNGHGNNREEQCTHNPNIVVYRKMEVGFKMFRILLTFYFQAIIKRMQDPLKGIPIKTVSTFMYKIPSVFSGSIWS